MGFFYLHNNSFSNGVNFPSFQATTINFGLHHKGMFVLYAGLVVFEVVLNCKSISLVFYMCVCSFFSVMFVFGLLLFMRSIYFAVMRVSHVEGPA